MNIKELKEHWELEKEQYKTSEVGSGVQKFVKEILLCTGIFNLNAGKLSTELKDRKNEFIEEAKKKGHRADVVIFIDRDIIIPVEIEKFKSIKSGEKQIIQYQTDWQKKLGLLTDGFEWRFYNNLYVEKTFTIESILNKPELFLEFWSEYTKPETYYRSFFAKQGQLQLFEYPPPNIDDVRQDFFIDITHLIESFKNKLNLKGYFKKEKDETGKHKKTVEITYAYLIQFILYKTLVDNAFETFEDDWKERIKNIDKALQAGIYGDILLKIKGISDKISEKIYKRFNDEQLIINERLQEIMQMPNQQIGDVSVWLDILLFIHRYNFANVQNEIFGYVYENYLKDLYLDEKKGQYFTDPLVVEFMLNEMVYSKENLKKRFTKKQDSISIIDPSCGSGTFLYNATVRLVDSFFENTDSSAKLTEKLINENIFGLDIAEFPLYLAEMNILMRMLPIIIHEKYNNPVEQKIKVFKTRDSIAEFFDTSIRNTITDINKEYKEKGIQYNIFTQVLNLGYDSFMRDKGDLDDLKKSLETRNSLPRYRFDYVVGNPPYVSYNECASQKVLIFELMKEGKIKLNDIYGFNLHSTPNNTKKYRPNPNLYAFFMALGVALLKDDGVISYIIPQTILTAGDLDVIRYHIASFLTIEKIVLFENKMFIGRGIQQSKPIATSSLIFILKKTTPSHGHKVKVIRYTKTDKDVKDCLTEITNRRNVVELEVSQKILLKNHENWNFLNFNNDIIELIDFYNKNTDDFSNYYTHLISKFYFNSKFIFDGGYSIDENCRLYSEPAEDYYIYPKFIGNTYSHVIANGYWPNHRKEKQSHFIALRQASQEYLLLDSKFKIVWSYANPDRFYFTDKKIIWARNQFNAIGSNNETELFYLFALLNSGLNFFLLRNYLRSNNEKDLLFSITSIKKFVRIPELISLNQTIKNAIIISVKELINNERQLLSDIVDFSKVLLQKYDEIKVIDNHLVIKHGVNSVKCKITGKPEIVKYLIQNNITTDLLKANSIVELKQISAFDRDYQTILKNYIDDLVFVLYFKISIKDIGFEHREAIKAICTQNKFYNTINQKS